jgi:hypothetical protein
MSKFFFFEVFPKQVAMKYSDKKEDYEGIFSTLTIPFFQLL